MAQTVGLQSRWDRGMRRDGPRTDMAPGALWNAVDIIVGLGAPLRQRGGWHNHTTDIASVTSTAARVDAGIYATFSTTAGGNTSKNLVLDDDGHLFSTSAGSGSAATSIGASIQPRQNPVFHGGAAASAATAEYTGLVIMPGSISAVPKKYNGTSLSDLNGSPPMARYATVYKDYTVLLNGKVGSTLYPNRAWFSPEGDPDCAISTPAAWDTTYSWLDFQQECRGAQSLRNAMMVFHRDSISRVRGSLPPPDSDMIVDHELFNVGVLDPRGTVVYKDTLIFAAREGVFRTDGVELYDMTHAGGMSSYWLDMVQSIGGGETAACAAGVYRDTLFVSFKGGFFGATLIDGFMVDLNTNAWTRVSNTDAMTFWPGEAGKDRELVLYFGRGDAAYVARAETMFEVGNASYKNDGNGTAVTPTVETGYFRLGSPGQKRVRNLYIGHEVTDHAADGPTCAVSAILTPEETAYTTVGTLSANTAYQRKRLPVNRQANGIALKFARSGAGDFLLYDVEAEAWLREATAI